MRAKPWPPAAFAAWMLVRPPVWDVWWHESTTGWVLGATRSQQWRAALRAGGMAGNDQGVHGHRAGRPADQRVDVQGAQHAAQFHREL